MCWRGTGGLPSDKKIAWAAPTTIVRHCPLFHDDNDTSARQFTIGLDVKEENALLKNKVQQLEASVGNERFSRETPARDIAAILYEMLSEPKFNDVVKRVLEIQAQHNLTTREAQEKMKAAIRKPLSLGFVSSIKTAIAMGTPLLIVLLFAAVREWLPVTGWAGNLPNQRDTIAICKAAPLFRPTRAFLAAQFGAIVPPHAEQH
jgi:hypothetical protein